MYNIVYDGNIVYDEFVKKVNAIQTIDNNDLIKNADCNAEI